MILDVGRKKCGTDLTHHVVQAFLAKARSDCVRCAMFFLGLHLAFHAVVRHFLLTDHTPLFLTLHGLPCTSDVVQSYVPVVLPMNPPASGVHGISDAQLTTQKSTPICHVLAKSTHVSSVDISEIYLLCASSTASSMRPLTLSLGRNIVSNS